MTFLSAVFLIFIVVFLIVVALLCTVFDKPQDDTDDLSGV